MRHTKWAMMNNMGKELIRKRIVTIEEIETVRDLLESEIEPNIYHRLSELIVGVTLVGLAVLAGISVLLVSFLHLYHLIVG